LKIHIRPRRASACCFKNVPTTPSLLVPLLTSGVGMTRDTTVEWGERGKERATKSVIRTGKPSGVPGHASEEPRRSPGWPCGRPALLAGRACGTQQALRPAAWRPRALLPDEPQQSTSAARRQVARQGYGGKKKAV